MLLATDCAPSWDRGLSCGYPRFVTGAVVSKGMGGGSAHWPALDGLRGLAVVAVLSYHTFPKVSPNGFAGVDVFFVLSGFLITSLLLREFALTGEIALSHFYMRRILRLYPALLLAVCLVLGLAIMQGELPEALPGIASAVVYMSHVTMAFGVSSGLLAHTWTLSLEEHYYLVWPAVLLAVLRGAVWRWVGLVALAGLVMLVPGVLPSPMTQMYWRALAMMVGSLAAIILHRRPRLVCLRVWRPAGLIGLFCLAVVVLTPIELPQVLAQGPFGIPSLMSVIVILGFIGSPMSVGARILALAPLRWLGKRAYGLYLYHFPMVLSPLVPGVLSQAGIDARLEVDLSLALVLTIIVSWASYRWVEEPFLRLKDRFRGGPSTGLSMRSTRAAAKSS